MARNGGFEVDLPGGESPDREVPLLIGVRASLMVVAACGGSAKPVGLTNGDEHIRDRLPLVILDRAGNGDGALDHEVDGG